MTLIVPVIDYFMFMNSCFYAVFMQRYNEDQNMINYHTCVFVHEIGEQAPQAWCI